MTAQAQKISHAGPQLADPRLFREQCYIDGKWADADSGAVIEVTNPANGEVLGTIPRMGAAETRRAIEAAEKAWPAWRNLLAKERANLLRKWFNLIIENQEDMARLMTLEQGKPLAEAKGEVVYGASFIEWFAEEAKRIYGDTIPQHQPDKRIVVVKQPVGVVAAITPWNFPNAMITRKCAPALAAGCPVVIKPATQTPYSAFALAELAERAGIPAGIVNVITGSAKEIGGEMTSNPTVRKLSFTGTRMRLAQTQVWPVLRNLEMIAPSTAASRSASSKTRKGALPPSSMETFFTVAAHCSISSLPTSVDPVKVSLRTMGFPVRAAPWC